VAGGFGFKSVDVTAYEVDDTLRGYLVQHLSSYSRAKTSGPYYRPFRNFIK